MKVVRNGLLLTTVLIAVLASLSAVVAEAAVAPVGTITESRVSTNGLNRVTLGPDNKLWFTECGATSSIGRIDPAQVGRQDPAVNHFPTPTRGSCPIDIAPGPGGNLWFTEFGGKIGRITTAGDITEFSVPGSPPLFGITPGPDGNLWFIVNCCGERDGKIGRMTPNGVVELFPVAPGTSPAPGITTGPDGNLWFTATNLPCDKFLPKPLLRNITLPCAERSLGLIERITTTGRINGVFVIPTRFADPGRIVTGPDHNLWFTEYSYEVRDMPGVQHGGNKIGRITTNGNVTEYPVVTPFAHADGINAGPDGAVYFTESPANNAYGGIGRAQA